MPLAPESRARAYVSGSRPCEIFQARHQIASKQKLLVVFILLHYDAREVRHNQPMALNRRMNTAETAIKANGRIPSWIWLHSGLFLSAMKMDFNFDLVTLAVPLLAISFGASSLQLGLLGALQRFLYILICPISGRLSDHWGRKGLAVSGAVLFGATCLALAQARNVVSIAWVIPWVGITLGLFWPALQGWLSDQGESQLRQSTSLFNLFWSAGSMLGMVLAGILMRFSSQLPFYVAAGVAASIAVVLARSSHEKHRTVSSSPSSNFGTLPAESSWDQAQRRAALTSIFMAYLVVGGVTTQFPKLATQLGYGTSWIGFTMGVLPLSRTIGFAVFDRSKAASSISSPLILVKLLLALAMAMFVIANSSITFMLSFALLGLVSAATFSFSQYLCLKNPVHAGRRIGYHESSMLGGIVIGSILSGLLAQNLGVRFAFAFGILFSILSLTAQPSLFHGYTRRAADSA
jgi:MFS family permease